MGIDQQQEDSRPGFRELLDRVLAGSQAAADLLVRHYSRHILRVVRAQLPVELRPKFDSSDFMQTVWQAVFADPSCLCKFSSSDDLLKYLAVVAANTVAFERRRQMSTAKRKLGREQSLDSDDVVVELFAKDPAPMEQVKAQETLRAMLARASEQERSVLIGRLAGKTCELIAAELNMHVRTVRKLLSRIDSRNDANRPRQPR